MMLGGSVRVPLLAVEVFCPDGFCAGRDLDKVADWGRRDVLVGIGSSEEGTG